MFELSSIKKTIITAATLIVSIGTLALQYTTGFLPANPNRAIKGTGTTGTREVVAPVVVPGA